MKNSILKYALKNAITHKGKAIVGAIIPKMIGENPSLKSNVKELVKEIKEVLKEVNAMSLKEQEKMLREQFPEIPPITKCNMVKKQSFEDMTRLAIQEALERLRGVK